MAIKLKSIKLTKMSCCKQNKITSCCSNKTEQNIIKLCKCCTGSNKCQGNCKCLIDERNCQFCECECDLCKCEIMKITREFNKKIVILEAKKNLLEKQLYAKKLEKNIASLE